MDRDEIEQAAIVVNSVDQGPADRSARRAPLIGRGMRFPAREARRTVTVLIVMATVTFGLLAGIGIAGIVDTRGACETNGVAVHTATTSVLCEVGDDTVAMPTQAAFMTILFASFGLLCTILIAVVYAITDREARRQSASGSQPG